MSNMSQKIISTASSFVKGILLVLMLYLCVQRTQILDCLILIFVVKIFTQEHSSANKSIFFNKITHCKNLKKCDTVMI